MEMVLRRKQELQKKGKKGFTLVELIVVIVILGILAAIAVPALVGYIDKARTDGAITEAATARTAMQTIVSDSARGNDTYASPITSGGVKTGLTDGSGTLNATNLNPEIEYLTSVDGYEITASKVTDYVIDTFSIKVPSGYTVSWDGSTYTVS